VAHPATRSPGQTTQSQTTIFEQSPHVRDRGTKWTPRQHAFYAADRVTRCSSGATRP
jgi:hypothetical protein